MKLPKGARLVSAIGISSDDKLLAATDASEKIQAYIFNIEKGKEQASLGINVTVSHLCWNPSDPSMFAVCGHKQANFCTVDSSSKAGGKSERISGNKYWGGAGTSYSCVTWSTVENDRMFFGGTDGKIYIAESSSAKANHPCGKKMVQSILCKPDPTGGKGGEWVFASSTDKTLYVYTANGTKLTDLMSFKLFAPVIGMDIKGTTLACGFKNGNIETLELKAGSKPFNIMNTHNEGEVWGMANVTMPDGSIRVITSADDNQLICYNANTHKAINEGYVSIPTNKKSKKKKAEKKMGASSMSNQPHENQSRALAYNPTNCHLAVANNMGVVTIREIDWKKVDAGDQTGLNTIKKQLFSTQAKPNRWIEIMSYSPDGKYLAIGDHKQKLTVYKINSKGGYSAVKPDAGSKAGHSSALNGIDWSEDSKWIRSTCQAGDLIYWEIQGGKTLHRDPKGASNTQETAKRQFKWATHTCKFGYYVDGIIPKGNGPSDINSVAMCNDQSLVATGDDNGLINIYRSPCRANNTARMYRAHSEHVTTVQFSED